MDEKTRELIAIGASVCAHCQPCVTYHVGQARKIGIDEVLISEAIAVGQMVEKGAGSAMREFTQGLLKGPATDARGSCEKGRGEKALGSAGCHCG